MEDISKINNHPKVEDFFISELTPEKNKVEENLEINVEFVKQEEEKISNENKLNGKVNNIPLNSNLENLRKSKRGQISNNNLNYFEGDSQENDISLYLEEEEMSEEEEKKRKKLNNSNKERKEAKNISQENPTPVLIDTKVDIEEIKKKEKIQNSDVILSLIEICSNPSKYQLSYSNKSRLFWDELFKKEELLSLFKNFKSETLRKYWRVINDLDKNEKVVETTLKFKDEINKENVK